MTNPSHPLKDGGSSIASFIEENERDSMRIKSAYVDDDDRLLDLDEAAECAAISPHTLRSHLQRGVGPPAYKIGSRWRVKMRDIKAWIEQAKVQPTQSPPACDDVED